MLLQETLSRERRGGVQNRHDFGFELGRRRGIGRGYRYPPSDGSRSAMPVPGASNGPANQKARYSAMFTSWEVGPFERVKNSS